MNFFLSPSIETPQLQSHRQSRARVLGSRICWMAMVLASVGAVTEWILGSRIAAAGNVMITLGAVVSWYLTERDGSKFYLFPIYFSYWFGGGLSLYSTGGLHSPYMMIYVITLFLTGVLLQNHYSRGKVAFLCTATLGFWGVVQFYGWGAIEASSPTDTVTQLFRYLIYSTAFFILMEQLFRSEEGFVVESENQARLLRKAHSDMAHAEKLAQVGKLVATTAHEFAQPVQVITMCSSMLRRGLPESGQVDPEKVAGLRQFAVNIQDSSARLGKLLNQLREFSRKDQFHPKRFDCREALQSVETMVRHDLDNRYIRFRMILPSQPVMISGDVMNVQQILFNLISNGRDAALRGEKPSVEVRLESFGKWARIHVVNSGPGIPIEEQVRIFEPYYTTKRRGEGTGLGLPVCQDLVTLNKGRIFYCSQPHTTEFVVDLPLVS